MQARNPRPRLPHCLMSGAAEGFPGFPMDGITSRGKQHNVAGQALRVNFTLAGHASRWSYDLPGGMAGDDVSQSFIPCPDCQNHDLFLRRCQQSSQN